MTNKEALRIIEEYGLDDGGDSELHDAIRTAVKLLKQDPCEDCISRKAVLDMSDFVGETPTQRNPYAKLEEVVRVEDIESLPSVTPTQRWIPVSERLPEFIINNTVSEDVLVFDGVDIWVGEYRKGDFLDNTGYWYVYGYDLEEYVDVQAWMPLPEPYKAESESADD